MIIYRYDKNDDPIINQQHYDYCKNLRTLTDELIVMLPNTRDLMFNASVEDLKMYRDMINNIIISHTDDTLAY